MAKVARPTACAKKSTKVWNQRLLRSQGVLILTILLLSISLHLDNSTLITDNKVYLKQANGTYPLARSIIERLTDDNTNKLVNTHAPPLDLWTSFWSVWAVCTTPIMWDGSMGNITTPIIQHCCGHGSLQKELQVSVAGLVVPLIGWWSWWTQSQGTCTCTCKWK